MHCGFGKLASMQCAPIAWSVNRFDGMDGYLKSNRRDWI